MTIFTLSDDSDEEFSQTHDNRRQSLPLRYSTPQNRLPLDLSEYENLRGAEVDRFSSSQGVKKNSLNLVNDFTWSKNVGNLELFKSQQIFYKLLKRSFESREELVSRSLRR